MFEEFEDIYDDYKHNYNTSKQINAYDEESNRMSTYLSSKIDWRLALMINGGEQFYMFVSYLLAYLELIAFKQDQKDGQLERNIQDDLWLSFLTKAAKSHFEATVISISEELTSVYNISLQDSKLKIPKIIIKTPKRYFDLFFHTLAKYNKETKKYELLRKKDRKDYSEIIPEENSSMIKKEKYFLDEKQPRYIFGYSVIRVNGKQQMILAAHAKIEWLKELISQKTPWQKYIHFNKQSRNEIKKQFKLSQCFKEKTKNFEEINSDEDYVDCDICGEEYEPEKEDNVGYKWYECEEFGVELCKNCFDKHKGNSCLK